LYDINEFLISIIIIIRRRRRRKRKRRNTSTYARKQGYNWTKNTGMDTFQKQ